MIDTYEMLELFENEPKILGDEAAGIYEYKKEDTYGYTIRLCVFSYDQFCSLTLSHKELENPLFELGFYKVDKIIGKDNKLIIQQIDRLEDTIVHFTPSYTLTTEERPA